MRESFERLQGGDALIVAYKRRPTNSPTTRIGRAAQVFLALASARARLARSDPALPSCVLELGEESGVGSSEA